MRPVWPCSEPAVMRLVIIVVLALWISCPAGSSQPYECSRGCPGMVAPVCGEDGLSYASGCLASCQGVAVKQQGRCGEQQKLAAASFMDVRSSGSSSSGAADVTSQANPAMISQQDMQLYSQQGYRLLGRADTGTFEPQRPHLQQQAGVGALDISAVATAGSLQQQQHHGRKTAAVRRSSRGYAYQLSPPTDSRPSAAGQDSTAGSKAARSVAGLPPMQIPLERGAPASEPVLTTVSAQGGAQRAAIPPVATAAATPTSAGTPHPAAAGTAAAAGAVGSGQDSQPMPGHELLVQYMQTSGRRRRLLQAAWQLAQQAASQVQQVWHNHRLRPHDQHAGPTPSPQQQRQRLHDPAAAVAAPQPPPQQRQPHTQQQQQEHSRALQYVLGKDDRREVKGTSTSWPFSAVGQFLYRRGSCTGVMVGPSAVLTAAHCVYSRQYRMWQQDMVFVPHRHRQGGKVVEPYGRIPVEYVNTYAGWTDNTNTTDALNYDLAVVKLSDARIGYKTGWLGLAWDKQPYRGRVTSAGYPGDKARGSLWVSSCAARDFGGSDTRFLNTCDSWNGQSGSPLWERRGQDTYLLRAVISYEACSCCTADCSCCTDHTNGGCKITKLHYSNILKWR